MENLDNDRVTLVSHSKDELIEYILILRKNSDSFQKIISSKDKYIHRLETQMEYYKKFRKEDKEELKQMKHKLDEANLEAEGAWESAVIWSHIAHVLTKFGAKNNARRAGNMVLQDILDL